MEARAYKRNFYLVKKEFQMRFILRFCALVLAGSIVTIGVMYFMEANSTTVAIVNSRVLVRTTADFILPLLTQTVTLVALMVSIAVAAVTLILMHRILGPLHRFKKVLQGVGEGDFSRDFTIRKRDQLHDVAEAFNTMTNKLRGRFKDLQAASAALKETINRISEDDLAQDKKWYLKELKKLSADLDRASQGFKA